MTQDRRTPTQRWLDGIDVVASTFYIFLMAIVAGAVIGVLVYIYRNWPAGYGIGPQGEGVYLGVGILLVIGWVMGQLAWIMRRRRRNAWTFEDGSEIPLPKINVNDSGFSIQLGKAPDTQGTAPTTHSWSWNVPFSTSSTRTYRLDHAALAAARAAHAAGASWDDVCRQVNPDWDAMGAFDRMLYQRALEAAVNPPDA